ncbi:putative reverse transcriptase domain-containing protein [Tanacetum coccineum]
MDLMNSVCKPYLDKFVIIFIDDILIYYKSKQELEVHLKLILELLEKEKLLVKFSKCEFWRQEVHFLRHVVNSEGIHVDPSKIEAVKNWNPPRMPTEIRVKIKILEAHNDAFKDFNNPTEMMRGLDKQFERKDDGVLYFADRIWVSLRENLAHE